mgnify:CR=1 FL=1
MTIQITSMQMPARTTNAVVGKRGSKYPLANLRAGTEDSIILDGLDSKKDHSKLSSAVANYKKAGGTGKFSIRTFKVSTPEGVEQTRVGLWRVE